MDGWEYAAGAGRFELIPDPFLWRQSARFACILDGYKLMGFEALAALANERLGRAEAGKGWQGTAIELWACLFFEHRRWHHAGIVTSTRQSATLDELCAELRQRLTGLDPRLRADLVRHLTPDILQDI